MGRRMTKEHISKDVCYHVEKGQAVDIETVIRLRSWIEDEVAKRKGRFKNTALITDYDAQREIFEFEIRFFK